MPIIGEIRSFAGNFVPRGWLACDGKTYPTNQYAPLSFVISNGQYPETFKVPDLRGRALIGFGYKPGFNSYAMGQEIGAESVTLNTNQLPAHNHSIGNDKIPITGYSALNVNVDDSSSVSESPSGNYIGTSGGPLYADASDNASTLAADSISIQHNLSFASNAVQISNTGGGKPLSIVQPLLATTWIICNEGTFPERG